MKVILTSNTSHIESFIHSKWIFLWLTMLVGVTYVHSLGNAFVSDDLGMSNSIAQWNMSYIFSHLTFLRDLIYVLIFKLAGAEPFAFRLSNILFHLGNTILVFTIVRRVINPMTGWIAASLFALHPILVESVAWIAGGVYTQYSFFFLTAFYLYISASESKTRYILSIFFFLLMCLTLDRAVVVILIFPLYEWCYGNIRKNAIRLIPFLTIGAFFCANILYSGAISNRLSFVSQYEGITQTMDNPLVYLPVSLSSYLQLFIWPRNLTIYHTELAFTAAAFALRVMVTLAAFAGSMYLLFRKRKLFFWVAVFLVPLLPFLTPLHISWLIAERYAYLSSVGMIVIFSYYFVEIMNKHNRKIIYWILFLFMLISLGTRTWYRTQDWKNEDTLWSATSVYSPSSVQNWVNLGVALSRKGDYAHAQEALAKALMLNPTFADIYYNMGVMDESQGDLENAMKNYQKALNLRPDYLKARERVRMLSP